MPSHPAGELFAKAKELADTAKAVVDLGKARATLDELSAALRACEDPTQVAAMQQRLATVVGDLRAQLGAGGSVQRLAEQLGVGGEAWVRTALAQATALAGEPRVQKAVGPLLAELRTLLNAK